MNIEAKSSGLIMTISPLLFKGRQQMAEAIIADFKQLLSL